MAFRILVVDDNADSALSMAMMLSMMGHETRTAHDGEAAVSVAEEFRPHVILLDIGLPKLNGYEVAQQIRQHEWGVSMFLVAVTGWGQDEDRRKAREVGFDSHFTKPLSPAVLEELLVAIAHRPPGGGGPVNTPRTRFTDSGLASA
jgi:CheY-like chemotaxis protein